MEAQIHSLIRKIKQILITSAGKIEEEASDLEFYQALCTSLKYEIMTHLVTTFKSVQKNKGKVLYYISMEHLPGKLLKNSLINMGWYELLKEVCATLGRSLPNILQVDPDPGLGNGGLGRLAACFMDSLATHHYPAIAYGLRYQYGIFEQEIWNGVQVERPDRWLLHDYPLEVRRDNHTQTIFFRGRLTPGINSQKEEIFHLDGAEEVLAVPFDLPIVGYSEHDDFSILPLRLWSTKESPHNFQLQRYNAGQMDQAAENTSITDVLYPNDNHELGKRTRLKQEFLLASASLKDILEFHHQMYETFSNLPDKIQIQINDTHPALIIVELMRTLTKEHSIPWKLAFELTQHCCNYTNHTILKESLEEWNEHRIQELLPYQYKILQKMNQDFCTLIRKNFPGDENRVRKMSMIEGGQIRMAHLAIYGSKKVNGVASLHTKILTSHLFKDFYELFPDKFVSITNGVTQRRWLLQCNPLLSEWITKRIGKGWILDFSLIRNLEKFASDPESQAEFLQIKKQNKQAVIQFLSREHPVRDFNGQILHHCNPLDDSALFDIQIKRFHEYKRQFMNALHLIMLFHEIKENPHARSVKRQVLIGGKAAPGYDIAKKVIHLFFCIARKINQDPEVSKLLRVSFIENFNVSKGELLFPAADLSEQISTAGMEASGTGNMKFAMNGALTIGTEDGSNIEMRESISNAWWPFSFGSSAEELDKIRGTQKNLVSWEIYLQNPKIKKAVDSLKDGSFAKTPAEHDIFLSLHENLLDGYQQAATDKFFVLKDLQAYYETQKKVEELYLSPSKWAETAIHNIAGTGNFSSDFAIENYAKLIWQLEKCPINAEILQKVESEFLSDF